MCYLLVLCKQCVCVLLSLKEWYPTKIPNNEEKEEEIKVIIDRIEVET